MKIKNKKNKKPREVERQVKLTQVWAEPIGSKPNPDLQRASSFFFFIFKKIKISKIYVRFENFRKYPRSPGPGATRVLSPSNERQDLNVIFF